MQPSGLLQPVAVVAIALVICAGLQGCSEQCSDGTYNHCLEDHCGPWAHFACGDEDVDCCVTSRYEGVAKCSHAYTLVSYNYNDDTICQMENDVEGNEIPHHTVCCEPEAACPRECSDARWGLREGACEREQCLNCWPCYYSMGTPSPSPWPQGNLSHQEYCGTWAATPSQAVCGYSTPNCCQDPHYSSCDPGYTLYSKGEEICDNNGGTWTCCQPTSSCPSFCTNGGGSWSCDQEECWTCAGCQQGSGCCAAVTAACEACRAGVDEEKFCTENPGFAGCPVEEFEMNLAMMLMFAILFLSAASCCFQCCLGCSLSCCSGPLESYGCPAQCLVMVTTILLGIFLWAITVFSASKIPPEAEPLQSFVVLAGYTIGTCAGCPAVCWRERIAELLWGAHGAGSARVSPAAHPSVHMAAPPHAAVVQAVSAASPSRSQSFASQGAIMGSNISPNAVQAVVVGYHGECNEFTPDRGRPVVRCNSVVVQADVVTVG